MNKRTKKMATTQAERGKIMDRLREIDNYLANLRNNEPKTDMGKKAHAEAQRRFTSEQEELWKQDDELVARYEVETIAMLAGEDTDMVETTPAEALENAS